MRELFDDVWSLALDTSVQCLTDTWVHTLVLLQGLLKYLQKLILAMGTYLDSGLEFIIVPLKFLVFEFQGLVQTSGLSNLVYGILSNISLAGRLALPFVRCLGAFFES
jgi:hypothetical protein